ncbi:hypothetical protein A3860_15800 [Niastella vici]|uniref:Histidine kinase N-terminal 7TM region domain-containing protein n=1 Tax=Niastella vici TaxID=1703345 RepID=A0A1V9G6C5_9BACT|nr:hypothetical protein A3860_15800 [Niastella vici]
MNFPALLIEIICLLASVNLFLQASIPKYLKSFSFFIALTIIIEITGYELRKHVFTVNLLYCFFTAFEFVYYLLIIRFIIYNQKAKRIIFWVMIVYPILVTINVFFIQPGTFHTITYSLGCLLVVLACIYYFFEIFRITHSVNLVKEPAFWLCTGLLFFYSCSLPLFGLWNQLHGLPKILIKNLRAIQTILNLLLYSLFSIAFLCRTNLKKNKAKLV